MSNFCDIIKKLREEKGYSQEVLAEELSVSKSTIAMWETNKRFPSKELYEQLADLFNVDIDFLYGRTEIRKKHHFDNQGVDYVVANPLNKNGNHYIDIETQQIAQDIFDNQELRLLYYASKGASADDLKAVSDLLLRLKRKETNEE